MRSLEQMVEEKYHELNENDLYIWQYIFHHRQACKQMSIQQLAKECNVSHTSIIRFARKIGLEGYSELKIYIKWSIDEANKYNPYLISQTTREMKQTIDSFEQNSLDEILKTIHESERIFIYGTGDVQANCAREIRRELLTTKKLVHIIDGMSELDVVLRKVTKKDVFLLLSFSGDNIEIISLVKVLKQMKVKTIGIGLDNHNLLYRYSDYFLGFQATRNSIGITNIQFASAIHYFLIGSMLTLHYIEYLNNLKKDGQ